jgi:ATP adenylyltransferase
MKVRTYMEKRGAAVHGHRRAALGYLSDSLRYEILRRAGYRCELCGVSAGERAIEVDHIFPRKRGGTDGLVQDPRGGVRGVIPGKAAY